MKKILIGHSPLTTITGYLIAALTAIHQLSTTGSHNWQDYILPAAIALLGRLCSDDRRQPPSSPVVVPVCGAEDKATQITSFQRRGKQHRQARLYNGRFAAAT